MSFVERIAALVDLSAVKADSDEAEIQALVELALMYHPFAVFSLPCFTERLVELLADSPSILIGGVVGFPSGGHTSQMKVVEAEELVRFGCKELDMVINIGWLRSGRHPDVLADIKAVVEAGDGIPVKVILETGCLTREQISTASLLCVEAGATFVKTGTGWGATKTTVEDIRAIKAAVGDSAGIKAAGGVGELSSLLQMREAGATRFGIGVRSARSIFEACDRDKQT
ncbi:MAG: deoxyribose-phosphate aldolase [Candidatus Bipolaricaulota bacterium]